MEFKILESHKITKEFVLDKLSKDILCQCEINEYLDVINAINNGESVFSITTNYGNYFLFIS